MSELHRDTDEVAEDSLIESIKNARQGRYEIATKWSEVHQHLDHHSESAEKIEHLESIIKWLVNHPANKVAGDCIGGGWSCDSYPDDDGTRREYFGADFLEAIELAMNGETE